MINAVLIDLPGPGRATAQAFSAECWSLDVEPEHVDVTSYDVRAGGVTVVPTIRVYDDAEPYGEPLVEHVGRADGDTIQALLREALCLLT
ncbi:hypothetical protein ACIRO1_36465 [Streptomyces sp. NPDC102381]|uniref:hypothetical protein n=1 Tax=Streptomyces sp. NPDC102381 TaxID=3366164 RepID=UPI0037F3BAD5